MSARHARLARTLARARGHTLARAALATLASLCAVVAVQTQAAVSSPDSQPAGAQPASNASVILDMGPVITLQRVKDEMRRLGIFDYKDPSLSARDRAELGRLFDAIEITMSSRNRQPSGVQSMFASMRGARRVVLQQHARRLLPARLARRFRWQRLPPEDAPARVNV